MIHVLQELGNRFREFSRPIEGLEEQYDRAELAVHNAAAANSWFTLGNIRAAFAAWAETLQKDKIEKWLMPYQFRATHWKKVGIIMAGNIPLVGLHDLLSVLVSGHIAVCKFSSKDSFLMKLVVDELLDIDPSLDKKILVPQNLKNMDALIATGSNNSMRYFEYYFGHLPHLFRSNRTSIAVLDGRESKEELKLLADDIFHYFGLGCRNVTKLFVPADFDLDRIFEAVFHKKDIVQHHKYSNNYDYNKSIYLLNKELLLENGFMLLKEDAGIFTPVSVVFYERYDDVELLKEKIRSDSESIQCVVSSASLLENEVPFGKSQQPELWDYADRVDTLEFLQKL